MFMLMLCSCVQVCCKQAVISLHYSWGQAHMLLPSQYVLPSTYAFAAVPTCFKQGLLRFDQVSRICLLPSLPPILGMLALNAARWRAVLLRLSVQACVLLQLQGSSSLCRLSVQACVAGMFELQDNTAFKDHLRDFLVQTKSFSSQDNADLFADEAAAAREVCLPAWPVPWSHTQLHCCSVCMTVAFVYMTAALYTWLLLCQCT